MQNDPESSPPILHLRDVLDIYSQHEVLTHAGYFCYLVM